MKASDLFVRALEQEGVENIFAVPGEENLDLLESLRSSAIKVVLTRHEQAAGFMAATYGRLTGKAGVCLATLGPGATNLMTPAAYAQLGAMPLFMITGQKPIHRSKQGRFQIVDVVEMMRPVTKYTRQIVNGNNIPCHVREGFRLAEAERPGAVHLELPEDVAASETDAFLFPREKIRRPAGDEKSIAAAVAMIERAKRPLLLIGAGGNRTQTSKMLNRLVDKLNLPFFVTQMGKGVIDERHPCYLGTAAMSEGDRLHAAVAATDLIINVGHDVVEKPPFFMAPGGMKVIHINYSSAAVDPVYFPQLEVVGDIANSIWQISEAIGPDRRPEQFGEIRREIAGDRAVGAADDSFPLRPSRLVAEVRRLMPEDGIVALDNGMFKLAFARDYLAYQPNTLLLDNALATMGAGLPSAIAAALTYPERRVMAICGDGGFMMSSQELETAIRLGVDLSVVVLRDNGYGMIKWKQRRLGLPDFGLDFGNPDFVAYAKSYGADAIRVESISELAGALEQSLERRGVVLVEVPVAYSV